MTVILILLAITIVCFLLSLFLVPRIMSHILFEPKLHSHEQSFEDKSQKGLLDTNLINSIKTEDFSYNSSFDYVLRGKFLLNDKTFHGKKRVVVLVHGYTSNYTEMLVYLPVWFNKGFNVVVYDHRGHGHSDKMTTTMGYYESQDLLGIVSLARERFGQYSIIGLHGESMGAATTMLCVPKITPHLDFAVEDCGYTSLYEQCCHTIVHNFHIPQKPYMWLSRRYVKKNYGFDILDDVNPEKALEEAKDTPMLFIHGDNDDFVPTSMVFKNYSSKPGVKAIRLFEGSTHACSYADHPKQYTRTVEDFLKQLSIE